MEPDTPLPFEMTDLTLESVKKALSTLDTATDLCSEKSPDAEKEPESGDGNNIVHHHPETLHESRRKDQKIMWL